MNELEVVGLPSQSLAYKNCLFLNLKDFVPILENTNRSLLPSKDEIKMYGLNMIVNDSFVFAVQAIKEIEMGQLGAGSLQRLTAGFSMNQKISNIKVYIPATKNIAIEEVGFELKLLTRATARDAKEVDCTKLEELVKNQFNNQYFTVGQVLAVDVGGIPIRLLVSKVSILSMEENSKSKGAPMINGRPHGQFLKSSSTCAFSKEKDTPLKLMNRSGGSGGNQIFKSNFDISKLGIGGLDEEFTSIFRRAFASRVFPSHLVQQMGIQHVRGMLLFGPPGCGKTLIARQIGKVLNAKEPKVVNGPEILDKFVGESERKIRDLFADARADQDENGEDSELHIIIFDEIDAVCKARGSSRDGTGVGDSVVNQLLTQIDGVDSLNNVLVIGMTNRKDMLDEALLRPGRLEVQLEINLPDEKGRGQILKIHTSQARTNGFLSKPVVEDLDSCINMTSFHKQNLAQRTKNFSGAEISGLVRAATAHALSRGTDSKTFQSVKDFKPSISNADFDLALTEVKPKFGSPIDGLHHLYRNGIIDYGPSFIEVKSTIQSLIVQVKANDRTSLMSVLLHGQAGTGKTALAAAMAVDSEYPLVRLVSAADFIGIADNSKCSKIFDIFQEAYRSPLSIVIIDDIERVLDYVPVGPRFSNSVLQALMVMIKNPPPVAQRKLLVIGITSSFQDMDHIGLTTSFDVTLELPQLKSPLEIKAVLLKSGVPISSSELDDIAATFVQPISIKKLLMVAEMARQDCDKVTSDKFIDCVYKFRL